MMRLVDFFLLTIFLYWIADNQEDWWQPRPSLPPVR
jgi:hypothetical protein